MIRYFSPILLNWLRLQSYNNSSVLTSAQVTVRHLQGVSARKHQKISAANR